MMKIEASRSAFSSCNDRFMKNYKQDVPFERQMEILRDIEYVDAIPVTYSPDTDPAALRGFMAQFGISPGTVVLDTYSQPRFAKGTLTSRDAGLRREFIEKGKAAMDFCHDIGGVDVMLWLAHDGYDYPFEDDYAARYGWLVEGLREIASHRPDVNVTIEYKPADPHIYQYVSTAPKALTICNEVALPNLGIILDYGHALVAGENPAESAALIDRYKRLFHVHLSDCYGKTDDDFLIGSIVSGGRSSFSCSFRTSATTATTCSTSGRREWTASRPRRSPCAARSASGTSPAGCLGKSSAGSGGRTTCLPSTTC